MFFISQLAIFCLALILQCNNETVYGIVDSLEEEIQLSSDKNCTDFTLNAKVYSQMAFYRSINHPFSIDFINFKTFNQFNLNCVTDERILIDNLRFNPKYELILDNSLSLNLKSNKLKFTNQLFLFFSNLKGIDLNLKLNNLESLRVEMYFFDTKLNLYSNGLFVSNCNQNPNSTVFNNIFSLKFSFSTKYSLSTCPCIFNNSFINEITIEGLADNFIKKNMLGFSHQNILLNSTINTLELNIYRAKLTEKLLSKTVFHSLRELRINGQLDSIQLDLITNFKNLKILDLNLKNFEYFIKNNLNWIESLNCKDTLILKGSDDYTFPDQDFCLFYKLPFKGLVLVMKGVKYRQDCSCTILWLTNTTIVDNQSNLFHVIFFINMFFNNILLLMLLNFIDLISLQRMRSEMKIKMSFMKKMLMGNSGKLKKAESVEIKLTSIIIINTLVLALLRCVELVILIMILAEKSNYGKKSVCFRLTKVCNNYQDLAESFYLISCSYSIVLYFYLNRNFRNILKSYFKM